jgi:branched-chain amino acid transport system permease protein
MAFLVSEAVIVALAYILSQAIFRVPSSQFVMLSLLLNIAVYYAIASPGGLARGALGLHGIPPVQLGNLPIVSPGGQLILVSSVYIAMRYVVGIVSRAPFSRVLHAVREDEVFACSTGKNVRSQKAHAFALMACVSVLAGSLYVPYVSYVDPSIASLGESILILSMMIIGGAGSLWGPALGAVVLVTFPEFLRFMGIPSTAAANCRQILYGLALVACMIWRPQGLVGEYAFGREAKAK